MIDRFMQVPAFIHEKDGKKSKYLAKAPPTKLVLRDFSALGPAVPRPDGKVTADKH